jgi:tetratricopeptide (TPR) repeat protein
MQMGQDEEALPILEQALGLAELAGHVDALAFILERLTQAGEDRGVFEVSRHYAGRALAIGEQLGMPHVVMLATIRLGALAFFAGDWRQARACFERVQPLPDRAPYYDAAPLLELGRLALAEGAWNQAAAYLDECSALTLDFPNKVMVRVAESLLAELDLLAGRPNLAVARLLPLVDRDGMEERIVTTYVLPVLAWAYLEQGEMDLARRTIREALRRARAAGYQLCLVGALRVQALIALRQGEAQEAEHALEEGLALARPMPYPYGEGRLLLTYGLLHIQEQQAPLARERLDEALTIFRRLGARKDIERAEQLLATLG